MLKACSKATRLASTGSWGWDGVKSKDMKEATGQLACTGEALSELIKLSGTPVDDAVWFFDANRYGMDHMPADLKHKPKTSTWERAQDDEASPDHLDRVRAAHTGLWGLRLGHTELGLVA